MAPLPPPSLADVLALFAADPTAWRPFLHVQRRADTGAMGAGIGPPFPLTPASDFSELEGEIARRSGVGSYFARLLRASGKGWSECAVVDLAADAVLAFGGAAPVAAPVVIVDPVVSALESKIADLERRLATPSTTSTVAADPFAIAVQVSRLQNEAQDRAFAMMQRAATPAAAPSPSATAPVSHEFWLGLGEKLAAKGAPKGAPSTDWASIVAAAAPMVSKALHSLDRLASAREKEAEARVIDRERALVEASGGKAALQLVPSGDAAAVDEDPEVVEALALLADARKRAVAAREASAAADAAGGVQ